MIVILTKFLKPQKRVGPRIIASHADGARCTVRWLERLSFEERHRAAAFALCRKQGWWPCRLLGGEVKGGMAWVVVLVGKRSAPSFVAVAEAAQALEDEFGENAPPLVAVVEAEQVELGAEASLKDGVGGS